MQPVAHVVLPTLVLGLAQLQGTKPAPVAAPATRARVVIDATPSIAGAISPENVPAAAKVKPANALTLSPSLVVDGGSEPPQATTSFVTATSKLPITASRSCKASDLKLAWPLAGSPGKTWVTHNYTDQDPGSGRKDYKGAIGNDAITYDKHRGYDIDVGSFREMDTNAVTANAAAPGKVIKVEDAQFDRNMSCTGNSNHVFVEHRNGFVTRYLHLKKGSAKVKVGDDVVAGQPLGIVGSSGCSTAPHLHLEVRDCDDAFVEPAKAGMWSADPATYELSGILDVMLRVGTSSLTLEQIIDPTPNPTSIKNNQTMLVGFSAALKAGDEVTSKMFPVNGPADGVKAHSWKVTGRYGQRWVHWSKYTFPGYTGPVLFTLFVNGQVKALRGFMVTAP